jgi:hypothetical protein
MSVAEETCYLIRPMTLHNSDPAQSKAWKAGGSGFIKILIFCEMHFVTFKTSRELKELSCNVISKIEQSIIVLYNSSTT